MSASPHSVSPSGSPIFGSPAAPSQALTENGRFSPYVQMSAAEPAAMAASTGACYLPGHEVVLFESYLHKTPPLRSLVMVSSKLILLCTRTHAHDTCNNMPCAKAAVVKTMNLLCSRFTFTFTEMD